MIQAILALMAAAAVQAPQDPPGFWERNTLLGDLGGARTALEERGIIFALAFTAEVLSNVHGGVRRDTGADLLLDWVIDADLDKAIGWTGGSARVNPMWLAGDGIAGDVGDLTLVSNITGRGEVRVFEAWLQQALGPVFSLRAGILAADQEFIISTSGLLYYNSVFGGPVFVTPNLAWPIYPVGTPGARARFDLAPGVYVQGALYDGDPGAEDFNPTGLRVRLSDADGLFTIVEAGWTYGQALPGTIKVGRFHHTADFVDFTSGATVSGLRGGYLVVEQKVWKGEEGTLDAFLRFGFSEEDRSFVSFGIDAGLNFTGLVPGRPDDVLGLGGIYAHISRAFARSQPDRSLWGHETVFEATYKIAISPWWSLQPDLQVIVHPGGSTAIRNAVVLAIRIDLLF
jgi:porin